MGKVKILLCSLICIISLVYLKAENQYNLIPYPNQLKKMEGNFEFQSVLLVNMPKEFQSELKVMQRIFAEEHFLKLQLSGNCQLEFRKNNNLSNEGYKLFINDQKILAEASTPVGCLWAFQTLRQLMSLTGRGSYQIPKCEIIDEPRYSWRGYLLDEGCYFKGKAIIKKLIDELSYFKMNVFHWHFVEDQGWRIEIKKYPLLTQIGAWRDSSQLRSSEKPKYDPNPHGGFYTQEDIKEIVNYADERHVTIVPEIEMPGHMASAIAAYPWLGSSGKPIKVYNSFGVKSDVLNVADERVYVFIQDVLKEVMTLFPGKVIHIGGDEVRYDQWKDNEQIQQLLKKSGFENYSDVQVDFTNRISNFLEENGRRMMGWNEILGKNLHAWSKEANATRSLAKTSIIHFWKGDPSLLKEAIENGYDVVNAWHVFTYLDYDYRSIPLEKSYSFTPKPKEIGDNQKKDVLGLECSMWGEWIPTVADLYLQTFPRLAAYAECGWTDEKNKEYERFLISLKRIQKHWDGKGILYHSLK